MFMATTSHSYAASVNVDLGFAHVLRISTQDYR